MKPLLDFFETVKKNITTNYSFSPENVYQEGCAENRKIISGVGEKMALPGSRIDNIDSLVELYQRCKQGESCLILSEHYSNFDYPLIYRFIEKAESLGPDVARSLLPVRGMKLSEKDPITAPFAYSYDTIVIYPSRTLDTITDPVEKAKTRKISVPINHAAIRKMIFHKNNGRIIVVFPAGTRHRPWDPNSLKGVREIHSYMKTFNNVVFMGINGNLLPPIRSDDMSQETMRKDLVILTCSDIANGNRYRKEKEMDSPPGKDPKQHVVDCVMEDLLEIHHRVEPLRLKEKEALQGE